GVMSSSLRPSNSVGRSNGNPYSSAFENTPCRSGSPHGVRGGDQRSAAFFAGATFVAPAGVWAARETAQSDRAAPRQSRNIHFVIGGSREPCLTVSRIDSKLQPRSLDDSNPSLLRSEIHLRAEFQQAALENRLGALPGRAVRVVQRENRAAV